MLPARRALLIFSCAAALAAAGCTAREQDQATSRFAASRSVAAHGLSVSVFVSQQKLGIADRLDVLIEARREGGGSVPWPKALAEAEVGKVFPPNPADPGTSDWTIVEATRRTLAPGHETIELILEPYLGGDKPIPAFIFGVDKQSLITEPIAVTVVSEHKLDSASGGADPLASLAKLDSPLPPIPPPSPMFTRPIVLGLTGAIGVLALCGGAAIVAARRLRRRSPTPDQYLDQLLTLGLAALAQPDSPHSDEVAEKSIRTFRMWLALTVRLAPGTSDRELAAWVRVAGAPSAAALADRLSVCEMTRFAPGKKADLVETRRLVEGVLAFTRELRASAKQAQSEGGRAQ